MLAAVRHVCSPNTHPLAEEWTRPLESVARAIADQRRFRYFDLGDFMIMGKEVRRPRPDVVLYKHRYTRRYLNLDQAGHAYRFIGPKRPGSTFAGRYVAHRDLCRAVDHLELWLLPWMKPGLETGRFGLSWDDNWVLHPVEVGDEGDDELAARAGRHLAERAQWEDSITRYLAGEVVEFPAADSPTWWGR